MNEFAFEEADFRVTHESLCVGHVEVAVMHEGISRRWRTAVRIGGVEHSGDRRVVCLGRAPPWSPVEIGRHLRRRAFAEELRKPRVVVRGGMHQETFSGGIGLVDIVCLHDEIVVVIVAGGLVVAPFHDTVVVIARHEHVFVGHQFAYVLLSECLVGIADSDGYPEPQGIGEFYPFCQVAFAAVAEDRVIVEYVSGQIYGCRAVFQCGQQIPVDGRLVVVRDGRGTVQSLRHRNRTPDGCDLREYVCLPYLYDGHPVVVFRVVFPVLDYEVERKQGVVVECLEIAAVRRGDISVAPELVGLSVVVLDIVVQGDFLYGSALGVESLVDARVEQIFGVGFRNLVRVAVHLLESFRTGGESDAEQKHYCFRYVFHVHLLLE